MQVGSAKHYTETIEWKVNLQYTIGIVGMPATLKFTPMVFPSHQSTYFSCKNYIVHIPAIVIHETCQQRQYLLHRRPADLCRQHPPLDHWGRADLPLRPVGWRHSREDQQQGSGNEVYTYIYTVVFIRKISNPRNLLCDKIAYASRG